MDTKLLRQKILDLAIRGKLVPQDPNDEPASVLLERIKAEKEQLIKEGKIKRSKKTATTSDSRHYPFELPSGWVWTTLGEISNYGLCSNVPVTEIDNNSWVLELEDLEKDSAKILKTILRGNREINGVRHKFRKGEILYSKLRTYLNKVLVAPNDGFCTTEIIPFNTFADISNQYICHVLRSEYFLSYTHQCGYGVKMPRLSTGDACKALIPLPPINEQIKIVQAIDCYFNLIEYIENDSKCLSIALKQAKNKILDLAIHGKLVPQHPADEPAIKLLKRVNPSAEITCDIEHYPQLPNGWILLKGKYVFNPLKSTKPKTDIFKYIDIDSIDNKKQCVRQIKKLAASTAPSRASRYTRKGDVLFAMVRPYLKNIAIVPESDCIASTGFYICSSNGIITTDYCYYLMSSDYVINGLNQYMKGDNSPSISKNDIENWEFPIPPINEQIRITESIKILFSKIDNIAENL